MSTFVLDIERKRGDTKRIVFTVKTLDTDGKTWIPLNISAWTDFRLTVDPSKAPINPDNNIGDIAGAILTDGLDGKCFFIPPGTWDIGKYFYDVQALDDNTEKTTIVEGKYTLIQDITKS